MLGALFTEQASWQVVVAAYFVSVDVILVGQYFWYTHENSWRERRLEDDNVRGYEENYEDPREVIEAVSPVDDMESSEFTPVLSRKSTEAESKSTSNNISVDNNQRSLEKSLHSPSLPDYNEKLSPKIIRIQASPLPPTTSPRVILFLSTLFTLLATASPLNAPTTITSSLGNSSLESAGRILSWTSTILYLGSRLPQIYKNHNRRSTSGLSPSLFAAAFTGNFFYSTSVLTNPLAWASYPPYGLHGWAGPEGSDRGTWIALAAPFWLGTAGVLALDATIGMQFLRFGEGGEDQGAAEGVAVRTEGKRGRWRNVSGWMRGWVPSPGPTVKGNGHGEESEESEDSSLLREDRESRDRRSYHGA